MLKTAFLVILSVFISYAHAQTSFSISGLVSDSKGETLPGATIFLSGTKVIDASDKDGKFQLANISPGSYVLIAKYLGFQPTSIAVTVVNSSISLKVILKENLNQLNQVVITADPDWEMHYQEFKKRFIGTTPNAGQCKILNKEALHFHFNKKTHILTADADELLNLENQALGYQINYVLQSFEYNTETGLLKYQGYPSFKDMESNNPKQLEQWKKNRMLAYEGSPAHFMKSVFDKDTYQKGYRLFSSNYDPANSKDDNGNEKPIEISPKPIVIDSLLTQGDNNFKIFTFKMSVFIVYIKENDTFNFKNSGYQLKKPLGLSFIPRGQYSLISLLDNDVTIDINGNYSQPGALLFKGHMAWEQIADMTPLEYKGQ